MLKFKKFYYTILICGFTMSVYSSAATEDDQICPGAPAGSSSTVSEEEIITQARTLKDEGKLPIALDTLVEKGSPQNPNIISMMDEFQVAVYNSAMNGTGEFNKTTGDAYLKRHAGLIVNGYAQRCLNTIALRSTTRYNDVTGRQYLVNRFTNHNDIDAGICLNVAAIESIRGFTAQTGLEYLEQQVTELEQLTGETDDKQEMIKTIAQHAIDRFVEFKYLPTLPKDEFSVGWVQWGDNPPTPTVYEKSFPTHYPEKVIFQQYAPKLFQKAQEQYIQQLYKVGEAQMKRDLGIA